MSGKIVENAEGNAAYYMYACCHNDGVSCHPKNRHCETCGWDPTVAKDRLENICHQLGIQLPMANIPPADMK